VRAGLVLRFSSDGVNVQAGGGRLRSGGVVPICFVELFCACWGGALGWVVSPFSVALLLFVQSVRCNRSWVAVGQRGPVGDDV